MKNRLNMPQALHVVCGMAIGILTCLVVASCSRDSESNRPHISIVQYVDHPALDACRAGFLEEMAALGHKDGKSIDISYENANGDPNLAHAIAEKTAGGKPSLVFTLATPMSQAMKRATEGKGIPIIFGAITDPVSAGLVETMDRPGKNITGTSDRWPYFGQLSLLKETLPNVRKVGVVFNPGEDNTRYAMAQTRKAAEELGLELVEAPVTSAAEVSEAALSISARCDAFYVPADNTAMASAGAIIKVANSRKIPVVAGDPETFKQGCIVGLGVSYRDLGVQNARQADKILKGTPASQIPVFSSSEGKLMVNLAVAKVLGIVIPPSVVERADETVSK